MTGSSNSLAGQFSPAWQSLLSDLLCDPRFQQIEKELQAERQKAIIYPPREQVFAAFAATPPERVRVVILGQDPYHGPGQAHGLSFSVPPGVPLPPSLRNIFKELVADLGCATPASGNLSHWAEQGVLLLNTLLTVVDGTPLAHRQLGWEWFTDGVIELLSRQPQKIVFLLWGAPAQKKKPLIASHQPVLCAPHPSPLSAHRGFFGSRPFSRCNDLLIAAGREPIEWWQS